MNYDEFSKYQFLVVHIAKRYHCSYLDLNDLIQAGYLGLVTGLNKKKDIDGKHLINYLSKYIVSEIVSTIKSYNNYKFNDEFFKIKKLISESQDMSLKEIAVKYNLNLETVIEVFNFNDSKMEVSNSVSNKTYLLNKRQLTIYNLVVFNDFSITKIAKLLHSNYYKIKKEVSEIYQLIR